MWFGTYEGLYRFDGYSYKHFRYVPGDTNSLSAATVGELVIARDGTLWIATQNGGVNAFNRETEQFTRYMHDASNPNSLLHNRVNALAEDDSTGRIWVGTDGGLNRIDPSTGEITHFLFDSTKETLPEINRIQSLADGENGSLWIGTAGGLILFNTTNEEWTIYSHSPKDPGSIAHNNVEALARDPRGTLWVGTGRGLDAFDNEDDDFVHYPYKPEKSPTSWPISVSGLQVDTSGRVWVGTNGDGLAMLEPGTGTFTHFPDNQSEGTHFRGTWVTDIYLDPSGMIWITTLSGINILDLKQPHFERIRQLPETPGSLSSNSTWALLEDSDGSIWIGTIGGGLNRMEKNSQKDLIHFKHDPNDPGSLRDNQVFALTEDLRGYIRVGTKTGLDMFDRNSGEFIPYNSVPDGWIASLHTGQKGRLWIGYFGQGLYRIDLPGDEIVHFDPDIQGFKHFRTDDGLPLNNIVSIIEGKPGILWMGTLGGGISRFDTSTETFTNFDRRDGLTGNDFLRGGVLKDTTGKIFFASNSGLNAFYPEDITLNTEPPPVVLTDFLLFNQSLPMVCDLHKPRSGEIHLSC